MHRDLTCRLRLLLDSLPPILINSKFLFVCAKCVFNIPFSLYIFRARYRHGGVVSISNLYDLSNPECLLRVSEKTDVNSAHINLLVNYFQEIRPDSFLDVGCGSGYLIKVLRETYPYATDVDVDYSPPQERSMPGIEDIKSDLIKFIESSGENSFDFVLCSHVIEHIPDPPYAVEKLR